MNWIDSHVNVNAMWASVALLWYHVGYLEWSTIFINTIANNDFVLADLSIDWRSRRGCVKWQHLLTFQTVKELKLKSVSFFQIIFIEIMWFTWSTCSTSVCVRQNDSKYRWSHFRQIKDLMVERRSEFEDGGARFLIKIPNLCVRSAIFCKTSVESKN